jgi:hypothetical protein
VLHQQITVVLGLFNNFSQVQNLNGESVETSGHEIFVQRILYQYFRGQTEEYDDKSIRIASVRAGNVRYDKYERALTHLIRHLVMSVQVSVILLEFHKNIPLQVRAQNCEKRLLASPCLSARPHGTTRFPLDGIS